MQFEEIYLTTKSHLAADYIDRATMVRTTVSMIADQIVTHDLSKLISLHMRKRRPIERLKDCPVQRYLIVDIRYAIARALNPIWYMR